MIELTLPFPPSVNHYWFQRGPRKFIGEKGKKFRQDVLAAVLDYRQENKLSTWTVLESRLGVHIVVYPPDKRKRDLDNMFKATLDALQHAGVYKDDSQIDTLSIVRDIHVRAQSRLEVMIWEI